MLKTLIFLSSTVKIKSYCNRKFTELNKKIEAFNITFGAEKEYLDYKLKTMCNQFYIY